MNEDGIYDDEYRGQGGTFVIDPATGKRVPEAEYLAKQEQAAKPKAKATAAADTPQGV